MKKKNENKGFTLVELIVVLVILAILAAILVPALLGYIDRARNQQTVLNAKSALTATQAELSSVYGKNATQLTKADIERIKTTADVPIYNLNVYVGVSATNNHAAFTVFRVAYQQDATTDWIYFDGKAWVEGTGTYGATAPSDLTTVKGENATSFKELVLYTDGAAANGPLDLKQ